MDILIRDIKKSVLFNDFEDNEINSILSCLDAKTENYDKETSVYIAGDSIKNVGIILSGSLRIQREDINGNTVVIEEMHSGDVFGEAFVCAGLKSIPVSVWSITQTSLLFIDYKKIITTCSSTCLFHTKLIQNILKTIAKKLIILNNKINIVQKNTIREKMMAYLESCIEKNNSKTFTIPFTISALSQYIGVNRSALSRELKYMKDENLIDYSGRDFTVF